MPSTCEFKLNKPNAVYQSGDTISGEIILNTTAPKDVRDISIIFLGEANVCWKKTKRLGKVNQTTHYESNELYIDNTTTVHGEGTLPAGIHTYNFQMFLPFECPTSCEGRYGNIRYSLTLKIIRIYRFDNVFNKELNVIKPQDLNLNPDLGIPIQTEDLFTFCFCLCSKGNMNVKLNTPFGGYAIGQSVKYSIHVQNQSLIDIIGYTIEFIRKLTFTAHEPKPKTRDDETIIYEKTHHVECLRLTTRIFDGTFPIRPTTPSTTGESIIKVQYLLNVTLNMAGCNKDKSIHMPIFIGTIPLTDNIPLENFPFVTCTAPAVTLDKQTSSNLPSCYKDLGLPLKE
ncbi:arrestin domain-containing protein 1-like isoform X2 [Lucilia sericata]|uniref:arrestin domain-containing protein 1-like isoform X2 n=1 Tax=Lucilia sericata TaxID=13632 RepID=UPI0018A829AC|nr:arrestin domain-containing protein 1-like isoform X2 [Lucilia sericata]